jgi:hypothetical protein
MKKMIFITTKPREILSEEILCFLQKNTALVLTLNNIHDPLHKNPPVVPILNQLNTGHLVTQLFYINFSKSPTYTNT